jgi:cytochrome P450
MLKQHTLDAIRVDYPAPPNVPKDRLVDLRWALGFTPNDLADPYEPCEWLNGPEIPHLLFNPVIPGAAPGSAISGGGRGSWVVTHYDDINRVYTDNDYFSNKGAAEFQALIGETFRSIPLAIDPPEHGKYRRFLMPHFSPARLERMEAQMRELAVGMINEFKDKGEVDVAWDFGRVFPVRIFMGLMGFPAPMFEQFLDWEWDILHSGSRDKMAAALRGVLQFLRSFIAEKAINPDDHLVSAIVHGQIEGKPLTEDEKIGMVWFLEGWIPSRLPSARCFAAWRCIRTSSGNYAAILS